MTLRENRDVERNHVAVFPCSEDCITIFRAREVIAEIKQNRVPKGEKLIALSMRATDGDGQFRLTVKWSTKLESK